MGKFESALANCERAILINPNYTLAYYIETHALYEIKKETGTNHLAINTVKKSFSCSKATGGSNGIALRYGKNAIKISRRSRQSGYLASSSLS